MESLTICYNKSDALLGEGLVDVSKIAKKVGFNVPVVVSSSLWEKINDIPKKYSYEDVTERLWNLLTMTYLDPRIRNNPSAIGYKIIMHHDNETDKGIVIKDEILLKAISRVDDRFKHILTIMLHHED